jgi:hypothetical protein
MTRMLVLVRLALLLLSCLMIVPSGISGADPKHTPTPTPGPCASCDAGWEDSLKCANCYNKSGSNLCWTMPDVKCPGYSSNTTCAVVVRKWCNIPECCEQYSVPDVSTDCDKDDQGICGCEFRFSGQTFVSRCKS